MTTRRPGFKLAAVFVLLLWLGAGNLAGLHAHDLDHSGGVAGSRTCVACVVAGGPVDLPLECHQVAPCQDDPSAVVLPLPFAVSTVLPGSLPSRAPPAS